MSIQQRFEKIHGDRVTGPLFAMARTEMVGEANLMVHSHVLVDAQTLAETVAIELNHDEWLDDESHWIWALGSAVEDEFCSR